MTDAMPTAVLINGAGLAPWIWEDTIEQLDGPAVAVTLPSRTAGRVETLSLADYAAAVRDAAQNAHTDRVVLVGHSLGATIAIEAAAGLGSALAGLVAVSAAVPEPGEAFVSTYPHPQRVFIGLLMRMLGTRPPESAIRSSLCAGLDEATTQRIVDGFRPESKRVFLDRISTSAPAVPSLYIETTGDVELPLERQREMARRLVDPEVIGIDTGHLPMLTQSSALASAIDEFRAGL